MRSRRWRWEAGCRRIGETRRERKRAREGVTVCRQGKRRGLTRAVSVKEVKGFTDLLLLLLSELKLAAALLVACLACRLAVGLQWEGGREEGQGKESVRAVHADAQNKREGGRRQQGSKGRHGESELLLHHNKKMLTICGRV